MSERFQNKYRIESARLPGHDYGSNGAYFVTICTHDRCPYLGEIYDPRVETHKYASQNQNKLLLVPDNVKFHPSEIGTVAINLWNEIPRHYPFVILDEFQFMPNHLHGIIIIKKPIVPSIRGYHYRNKFGPQSCNLSSIMRAYKGVVKAFATTHGITFGWQPRFHDNIIRSISELNRIRKYIKDNPGNWHRDRNNPPGLYM